MPINAGDPTSTAIVTMIPSAIPTIMNLLFTNFTNAT